MNPLDLFIIIVIILVFIFFVIKGWYKWYRPFTFMAIKAKQKQFLNKAKALIKKISVFF
ncbi:MAG: hypothetical protein V1692_02305 [bacterium]